VNESGMTRKQMVTHNTGDGRGEKDRSTFASTPQGSRTEIRNQSTGKNRNITIAKK
jgi:hypothetical protein